MLPLKEPLNENIAEQKESQDGNQKKKFEISLREKRNKK